jgi:hypothetical protein
MAVVARDHDRLAIRNDRDRDRARRMRVGAVRPDACAAARGVRDRIDLCVALGHDGAADANVYRHPAS